MSKSKGNVISPEDHLDEYGADSLRQALLSLTIGSDFAFRWETVKYGKGFLQKYWSASRFAQPFLENYRPSLDDMTHLNLMDKWILARLVGAVEKITEALDEWQFHIAVETVQNFFWHDFCDQYLEAVKSRLYDEEEGRDKKAATYTLYTVLLSTTLVLAPICPHITEEVLSHLFKMKGLSTVHAAKWPEVKDIPFDKEAEAKGAVIVEALSKIRGEKARAGIPLSAPLDSVTIKAPEQDLPTIMETERDLKRILRIKDLRYEKSESIEAEIKRS
jgi:valyl-tRNA synthetase